MKRPKYLKILQQILLCIIILSSILILYYAVSTKLVEPSLTYISGFYLVTGIYLLIFDW